MIKFNHEKFISSRGAPEDTHTHTSYREKERRSTTYRTHESATVNFHLRGQSASIPRGMFRSPDLGQKLCAYHSMDSRTMQIYEGIMNGRKVDRYSQENGAFFLFLHFVFFDLDGSTR